MNGSPEPPAPPPRNHDTSNSSFNDSKESNEISEAECDRDHPRGNYGGKMTLSVDCYEQKTFNSKQNRVFWMYLALFCTRRSKCLSIRNIFSMNLLSREKKTKFIKFIWRKYILINTKNSFFFSPFQLIDPSKLKRLCRIVWIDFNEKKTKLANLQKP